MLLNTQSTPRFAPSHARTPTPAVPGTAAGWVDCVARFGSGKFSMQEVLAPAIALAEEGFPVR